MTRGASVAAAPRVCALLAPRRDRRCWRTARSRRLGPRVQILSPGPDAYVSGATLLRVRVDPPNAASLVVFFVDGKQICALTKLPYECEWDAGVSVAEHQVRVAVTRRRRRTRLPDRADERRRIR